MARIQGPYPGETNWWERIYPELFRPGGLLPPPDEYRAMGARYGPTSYRRALGQQYNWLFGGRTPTREEALQLAPPSITAREAGGSPYRQYSTFGQRTPYGGKLDQLNRLGYFPSEGVSFDARYGAVGGFSPFGARPYGQSTIPGGPGMGLPSRDVTAFNVPGGKGAPGGQVAGKRQGYGVVGEDETYYPSNRQGYGTTRGGLPTYGRRGAYRGEGPDPYAQGDYGYELDILSKLPADLLGQYGRIADQGIYGLPGINTLIQTGIAPARARTERMTGDILGLVRAGEAQTRAGAARGLGRALGGRMAGQPGRVAEYIASTVIRPSLDREAALAAGLKESEVDKLNQFDLMTSQLLKENMMSKAAIGLPGIQRTLGFIGDLTARRYKDTSLENKFGWAPERKGAVQAYLDKWRTSLNIEEANYWNAYYKEKLMRLEKDLKGSGIGFDDLLEIGIDIGSIILSGGATAPVVTAEWAKKVFEENPSLIGGMP